MRHMGKDMKKETKAEQNQREVMRELRESVQNIKDEDKNDFSEWKGSSHHGHRTHQKPATTRK